MFFELFIFEKIEKLVIQLVVSMYITFSIIRNLTFQVLLGQFSLILAISISNNSNILCS